MICNGISLIEQTFGEAGVGVDAAVAEEGPVGAGDVHLGEVHGDDEDFLLFDAGLGEKLAGGAGDEALAPELDAVAASGFFQADAIGDGDEAAVGDGVAALDEFPGAVLVGAVFGLFPADASRWRWGRRGFPRPAWR